MVPTNGNASCSVYDDEWPAKGSFFAEKKVSSDAELFPSYTIKRVNQITAGLIGSQCGGVHFEAMCRGGWYCPTPNEKIRCPSGHLCRTGSSQKHECILGCRSSDGFGVSNRSLPPYTLLVIIALSFALVWMLRALRAASWASRDGSCP